jgi:hypothetical protein
MPTLAVTMTWEQMLLFTLYLDAGQSCKSSTLSECCMGGHYLLSTHLITSFLIASFSLSGAMVWVEQELKRWPRATGLS